MRARCKSRRPGKVSSGPARRRRLTHDAGLRAEQIAELWLRMKLYRILARRYRVDGGEIDIIAQRETPSYSSR